MKLPLLIESILALVREKEGRDVFVNSHQLMLDMILKTLQFHPQSTPMIFSDQATSEGKWWVYHIV